MMRSVELTVLVQVDVEFLLALELDREVDGQHVAQVALLAVDLLLRVHLKGRWKVSIIVFRDVRHLLKTRRLRENVREIDVDYFHISANEAAAEVP